MSGGDVVEQTAEQARALADFELARLEAGERRKRGRRRLFIFSGPIAILGPILIYHAFHNALRAHDIGALVLSVVGMLVLGYALRDVAAVVGRQFEEIDNLRDRLTALERRLIPRE
jgi:hypothetical protein